MKNLTYQFSNLSQIWTIDPQSLRPLNFSVNGVAGEIFPPASDYALIPFKESLQHQPIQVRVGLIRVRVSLNAGEPEPEWRSLYEFLRQSLLWIRVATRQYWVGIIPSQQTNSPTALFLREEDGKEQPITGLGAIRAGIRWIPLDCETWEAIEATLFNKWWPSISEQFLMDSSLHVAEGNFLQGIAGVGIACEIELNNLIDNLITRTNQEAVTRLYKVGRPQFSWKLEYLPQLLGAQPFEPSNSDHRTALKEMYDQRGTIVHKGQTQMSGHQIARYWFAAEEFFRWSRLAENEYDWEYGQT